MQDGFGTSGTESTQPTQSIQSTQSDGDPGLTAATKAGIALALIGGILLGLLGAFGISYWKRKRKSNTREDMSDPVGRIEGGVPAIQALETHECESGS